MGVGRGEGSRQLGQKNYTRSLGELYKGHWVKTQHVQWQRDGGTKDCHARGRGNVVSVSGDGEVWQMSLELTVGCERLDQCEKMPRVPGPHVACLVRRVQGMLQ